LAFPSTLSQGITTNAGFAELQSDFEFGLHNSVSVRYDDNSRFGNKTTWRIAPAWVIEDTRHETQGQRRYGFQGACLAAALRHVSAAMPCSSPKQASAMMWVWNSRCWMVR
jgi:vitamin B12 transporter